MPRLLPAPLALVVVLGLLPWSARPAAAFDRCEETEHRLKTAGVGERMRERIHAAIRLGVARLRGMQDASGSIQGKIGETCLVALALRHASIPQAQEGAELAHTWLLRRAGRVITERTYEAGITAMLLQSMDAEGQQLRLLHHIHERLARGPRASLGYWSYRAAGGSGPPNLSTAQFACLGLWAAERGGAPTARRAWSDHLEALVLGQQEDGSWNYYAPNDPTMWKTEATKTYPTGTFMGLANLELAVHALGAEIEAEPERHARTLVARAAARAALRRHAQWALGAPGLPQPTVATYSHYALYALEKASIFLDAEDLGGVRWYLEGAEHLLGPEKPVGGKRGAGRGATRGAFAISELRSPVDLSFALLFLLRASESYRPVTPRPIDGPQVTTPRSDDARPGPADVTAPLLKQPQLALDRIEAALEGKRLTRIVPLLSALRFVARTHDGIRAAGDAAGPLHQAWCRRAEDLLLRCAPHFLRRGLEDRLLWQAVALGALDALAHTDARVAPALLRAVLEAEEGAAFRGRFPCAWYGSAIETLRRLDPPGLPGWLGEQAVHGDLKHALRTSAALTALGAVGARAGGRQRYRILRSVLTTMMPILHRSHGYARVAGLQRDVLTLLRRVSAPSDPDDFPELGAFDPEANTAAALAWWQRHQAPDDPLWRE